MRTASPPRLARLARFTPSPARPISRPRPHDHTMDEYGIHEAPADVVVADHAELNAANRALEGDMLAAAAKADVAQRTQTWQEAFHIHKRAIFWSMALSGALVMEGYDVVVIASFYGQPNFCRRFGVPTPGSNACGGYGITAEWQSALSNAAAAGGILGLLVNGWAADRYGPKVVMSTALVALTGFIAILVFANSLTMLVIGEVLCGIPWGVFQTLTTAYASEVCPIQLRGYLTAYVNLCWGVGILLSSGVVTASLKIESDWSWRMPFIVQWVWILPLLAIVYFAPPSPWWLVRKGRRADAEAAVRRLTNPDAYTDADVRAAVGVMVHTDALEQSVSAGTTYADCFRRTDARRSEVVMMVFAMQLLSGENLIGQGVQFLQAAGMDTATSFDLNMVLNSMFIIGTIASWGLLTRFGRRTLYTGGMASMSVVLFIIGGLGFIGSQKSDYAIGSLLIFLNFAYNATLGPICYTIIGEVSSTRLRAKSIVLARISYQLMNIVCGIIVPRMLSPTAWNWGPKYAGLFWGASAGLSTVYCLLRLPETGGRSYGELDLLFEHKVPAWRFARTKADQFAVHGREVAHGDADLKEDAQHVE